MVDVGRYDRGCGTQLPILLLETVDGVSNALLDSMGGSPGGLFTEDRLKQFGQGCRLVQRYGVDETRRDQCLCALVGGRPIHGGRERIGGSAGARDDDDPPPGVHAALDVVEGDLTAVDKHGDRR